MEHGGRLGASDRQQAHIKGEAIRQFVHWFSLKSGEARLCELVRSMPPDAAAVFDVRVPGLGIISSDWYPAWAFHALIDEMLAGRGAEQRRLLAREAARATIMATLNGVYRMVFETIMTPDRYLVRAQKIFNRFYDSGKIVKTKTGPTAHLTVVRDWPGHHPVLCDVNLYTGEYVYPHLGCRNVAVKRLGCLSTGAEQCSYEVTWD